MRYKVKTTPTFDREFRKLNRYTQLIIKSWVVKNLVDTENPRQHGKPLIGDRKGQWRYRIGDYRLICEIRDSELLVLALTIGHRREIYK